MIKESKVRLVTIEKLKGQVDEFLKVRLLRPNHMLLRTHTLSLSARYRSPDKSSGPCQPFDIRDERHTYTVNEVFLPADYILIQRVRLSTWSLRTNLSIRAIMPYQGTPSCSLGYRRGIRDAIGHNVACAPAATGSGMDSSAVCGGMTGTWCRSITTSLSVCDRVLQQYRLGPSPASTRASLNPRF